METVSPIPALRVAVTPFTSRSDTLKLPKVDRKLFIAVSFIVSLLLAFALGFYSVESRNPLYYGIKGFFSEARQGMKQAQNLLEPIHFLQPARFPGTGVTINKSDRNDLILVSGFFEDGNEIRLLERSGEIVNRWPVRFSALFPDPDHMLSPPQSDWNIDIHGVAALSDGSVVFNFEYGGTVKLDRCGEVTWTLDHPTHHSIAVAENGDFWIPGRRYHEVGSHVEFPPFSPPFSEDLLLRVSHSGEILQQLSVPGLFYANEFEALLTSNGESIHPRDRWDEELVHLNSIDVLDADLSVDFPGLMAGDLLLSLREFNMLLIANPDSREIRWWRIGPWVRQHDAQFAPGGKIIVFNNNAYRADYGSNQLGIMPVGAPLVSSIQAYDFADGSVETLYGQRPGQAFLTIERGKVKLGDRNDLLITEFGAGRILEVDSGGHTTWELINRYDNIHVAEVTEARRYARDFFAPSALTCHDHGGGHSDG